MSQYLYFLIACSIFSVIFGFKNQSVLAKITACFFSLLLLVELVCSRVSITDGIYNFWYPVEFGFYCWFLYRYMQTAFRHYLLALPILAMLYCYGYYFSHWQTVTLFYTFGYGIFVTILFVFVIIKIYELLTDENDLRFPFKIPLFWFLLGLILNLSSFLLFGMKNYILSHNRNLYVIMQYSNQILSSIQYLCFIIYFYCSYKFQNWNL